MSLGALGLLRRLEGLLLFAMGVAMCLFAAGDEYTALMNASFRWVTLAGGCLIAVMGAALVWAPARVPKWGTLGMFAVLILLVVFGRPISGTGTQMRPPAGGMPEATGCEDLPELEVDSLFSTLSEEADDVVPGPCRVLGLVHRTPALDAQGQVVVLQPMMACCIADAVAFGVRVNLPPDEAPPEDKEWIWVCGALRRLLVPLETERFRVGAIMFTPVSRSHVLDAERILSSRALMEDVFEKIPADYCGGFRRALEVTGIAEELRGEGPFTVFAPLDASFDAFLREELRAASDPARRAHLRRRLEGFVVRGLHVRPDLFEQSSLETMSGRAVSVEAVNGKLRVEGARILFGDQVARNGVVHIVNPAWPPEDR